MTQHLPKSKNPPYSPHLVSIYDLDFDMVTMPVRMPDGHMVTTRKTVGMPKIPFNVASSSVFLYDRSNINEPQGTGFILAIRSSVIEREFSYYLVTNHHLAISGCVDVVGIPTRSNDIRMHYTEPTDWVFDPDGYDVAITPFLPDQEDNIHAIEMTLNDMSRIPPIINDKITKEWQISIGDDVFMCGLFTSDSHEGMQVPKARFGHISAMPSPQHHYPMSNISEKPAFLLDMQSQGGFSGSPVFMYRTIGSDLSHANTGAMVMNEQTRFGLLGIHSASFKRPSDIVNAYDKPDVDNQGKLLNSKEGAGITICVPAGRIHDLFNHGDVLLNHHNAQEKKRKASAPSNWKGAKPD